MKDERRVVGISQPLISESEYLNYNITDRLVNPHNQFIVGNILVENEAEKFLLNKQFDKISKFLNNEPLLKKAVFAITNFQSINDWEAIRVFEIKSNIYKEIRFGLVGTCKIKVVDDNCEICYWIPFKKNGKFKMSA